MAQFGLKTFRLAVNSAGTAERIVSTHTKVKQVVFQAIGTHGIIIGDSDALWATLRGLVISDGAGAATTINASILDLMGADISGLKGPGGNGWFDLNDIFVDADTSSDAVFGTYIPF